MIIQKQLMSLKIWNTVIQQKKVLLVFADMIEDMWANKKFNLLLTELFIGARKLNISLGSISKSYIKSYFTTHYFIIKLLNKRGERQLTVSSHWSHIEFKDFLKL